MLMRRLESQLDNQRGERARNDRSSNEFSCGRMVFGTDQSAVGGESERKSL